MTKLLVSVRSACEAFAALSSDADLIDVKEPARGALGAAEVATIEEVLEVVARRVPTSAALGELLEGNRLPSSLAGRLDYAKFGLAGCARLANWQALWQAAVSELPDQVMPVAVAYADWREAEAPDPLEVISVAKGIGCRGFLLDTFDKTSGPLGTHETTAGLQTIVESARAAGLLVVLAGGLKAADIRTIAELAPDYIGVRGAVCSFGRESRLDGDAVRRLTSQLRDHAAMRLNSLESPAVAARTR